MNFDEAVAAGKEALQRRAEKGAALGEAEEKFLQAQENRNDALEANRLAIQDVNEKMDAVIAAAMAEKRPADPAPVSDGVTGVPQPDPNDPGGGAPTQG